MRRILLWAGVVVVGAALGCDTPSGPRANEGPFLEPDGGVSASVNPAVVVRASGAAHRDALGAPVILNFSAVKYADGTVDGQYYFRALGTDPDQMIRVRVTCMTVVDGNKAWIGGIAEDAFLPALIGRVSYFYAFDNGEGANAESDIVSRVRANDVEGQDEVFCDELPEQLGHLEVLRGNVNIEG
jgi:hypothetical protein